MSPDTADRSLAPLSPVERVALPIAVALYAFGEGRFVDRARDAAEAFVEMTGEQPAVRLRAASVPDPVSVSDPSDRLQVLGLVHAWTLPAASPARLAALSDIAATELSMALEAYALQHAAGSWPVSAANVVALWTAGALTDPQRDVLLDRLVWARFGYGVARSQGTLARANGHPLDLAAGWEHALDVDYLAAKRKGWPTLAPETSAPSLAVKEDRQPAVAALMRAVAEAAVRADGHPTSSSEPPFARTTVRSWAELNRVVERDMTPLVLQAGETSHRTARAVARTVAFFLYRSARRTRASDAFLDNALPSRYRKAISKAWSESWRADEA